jgi:hypothetical protein
MVQYLRCEIKNSKFKIQNSKGSVLLNPGMNLSVAALPPRPNFSRSAATPKMLILNF